MGFYLLFLVDYFSNDQLGITIAFVMLDILGKKWIKFNLLAKIYYTSNHIICLDFVWIAT